MNYLLRLFRYWGVQKYHWGFRCFPQVDSVNKPGILLEVVQILTDLDLVITKAYISSDGGWFMDGEYYFSLAFAGVEAFKQGMSKYF